jgi:hypothetical protein
MNIAVFIKNPGTLTEELDKLASLTTAILLDTGAVISANPFFAGAYQARTAFMHDLRKDWPRSFMKTGNCQLSHQGARMP